MKRGRPIGSRKRAAAIIAANAIRDGWFHDIREAARACCPKHIADDTFRNIVDYVELELREPPISMRVFKILGKRSQNRARQPSERCKRKAAFYRECGTIPSVARRRAVLKLRRDLFTPLFTGNTD